MRGIERIGRATAGHLGEAVRVAVLLLACCPLGCASMPRGVPVGPGDELTSRSEAYSLTLMAPGWLRLDPEHGDHADADLLLQNEWAGVTAVVYVHRSPNATLDWAVLSRRELVASEQGVLAFQEERSFLPASRYVAVSIARYRLGGGDTWIPLRAATVRGRDAVIELLAIGGTPAQNESLLGDLVGGLRLPETAEGEP
jgi:hypothetical protein